MKKLLFLVVFFVFLSFQYCKAQIDTEFWFAPPEVTSGHGDRPILVRLATLDQPAEIEIRIPAKYQYPIKSVSLNANESTTIDLSSLINQLETRGNDAVQNTGLYIKSTSPISAYYEIGHFYNADIFALKGANANGNDFLIPSQNIWDNGNYSPTPYSSFDIVATKNNTVVWITPSNDVVGHNKGEMFTIKLNKGQTYSVTNVSQLAFYNLGGSIVKSNKPIAITIKEDSLFNNGCLDVIGDQLVPTKVAGKEYVVIRGYLNTDEFIIVTAIENNTTFEIHQNNAASNVTLNRGEMRNFAIVTPSTYIKADKPVYVTQITGFGCELGMAIIPAINCRGSNQISFTRATSDFFGLNILVRKEGISNFSLNGNSNLIGNTSFFSAPGTNDEWYFAQLSLSNSDLAAGQSGLITNTTHSFQVGVINGDAATSTKFGYFSAFSTLFVGDDIAICEGDSITLDAGGGKDQYAWSNGSTTQKITVTTPGKYYVSATTVSCQLSDTITIEVKKASFELGSNIVICEKDTAKIDAQTNFSYLWNDGSTDQILETTEAGIYTVEISDYTGCKAIDSLEVLVKPLPVFDIGSDVLKCPKDTALLSVGLSGVTYHWSNGSQSESIIALDSNLYYVDVTLNGCTARDSVVVDNYPGPVQDFITGAPVVCPFVENITYQVDELPKDSYSWFVEGGFFSSSSNTNSVLVNWLGANNQSILKAIVTDSLSCVSDTIRFPVVINEQLSPSLPIGADTVCVNAANNILYATSYTNGSTYTWHSQPEIMQAPNKNEVLFDFPSSGWYELFVDEHSETLQAVCDGTSPILHVLVYKDSSSLTLDYVTVNHQEQAVEINWEMENPNSLSSSSIPIYRKDINDINWQLLDSVSNDISLLLDFEPDFSQTIYQYQLEAQNSCGELLSTNIHNNIRLLGSNDSSTDLITIAWNYYNGWNDGVIGYEIWRKLDDKPLTLYKEVDNQTKQLSEFIGGEGFKHVFFVKAKRADGTVSWSNSITLEFEHQVTIPNVITPNFDGKNDNFVILKIELYKESHLKIFNRAGKVVFDKTTYDNSFDAKNNATGVYFYHLNLGNGKTYSGTLTVLK
ncbi:MAG: gliding motility-associated C-terminal domain-containing protein [Cyclobacteriaceae bacterium]|nr:gliding motility-associated C-terminal domain-containing protein [Cyclobacteriaceae bacterium]